MKKGFTGEILIDQLRYFHDFYKKKKKACQFSKLCALHAICFPKRAFFFDVTKGAP